MAVARYLLDTNHAGTLLDDRAPLWSRLIDLDRRRWGVCEPTVGELWFMVFNSQHVQANRLRLEAFLGHVRIWPFDSASAIEFGRIRADLRRKGQPIPAFDVMIASIARVNRLTLLTADRHFQAVSGLPVQNWLLPHGD